MEAQLKFVEGPVLGIESSCDETSAAVVLGRKVLSNVVSSQTDLHRKWGGVVPEAAARAHVEAILPVIAQALLDADVRLGDVAGVAATNRPGLVGALSVGLTAAKALGMSLGTPFLGVHHLEGHLVSVLALPEIVPLPQLALLVSGGHTELVRVSRWGSYELLGQTLDDAAGEAFDKGARLLGLGYPGGLAIQNAAIGGSPTRYKLPKGLKGPTFDFSFSGLKTAVLRLVESEGADLNVADAAASLQEAIVSVLAERALNAVEATDSEALSIAGGVAANRALRERLHAGCERLGVPFFPAPVELCTDNAAMIALAGSMRLALGERSDNELEALPNAPLP